MRETEHGYRGQTLWLIPSEWFLDLHNTTQCLMKMALPELTPTLQSKTLKGGALVFRLVRMPLSPD